MKRLEQIKHLLHETTLEAYDKIVTDNAAPLTLSDDNNDEQDTTRAGQETGLALFGTSDAYTLQLEKEYDEKLTMIEAEATSIREELEKLDNVQQQHQHDGTTNIIPVEESDALDAMSASQLRSHVQFLQLCSSAHQTLKNIDALSLPHSNQQAVATMLSFSPSSMLYSPTSSADNDRFTFDTTDNDNNVVNAAKLVVGVEGMLDDAMCLLRDYTAGEGGNQQQQHQQQITLQQHMQTIVDELRNTLRRKKMELRYRAISTLESCVSIKSNALCVYGSGGAASAAPKTVSFGDTTPRDDDDAAAKKHPSPMGDAYSVLKIFHNDQYPVFGETLDRALCTIGKELFDQIFESTFQELGNANNSDTLERRNSNLVGYYKFKQEIIKNGTVGKKYDAVVIKGQGMQLIWEWNTMEFRSKYNAEEDEPAMISVSSELNEGDLAVLSPLAGVANYLSYLNFVLRVLEFVQKHVLLQRNDLASIMGKYLFGTYPIPTSLSSGSAMLGGMIVGSAAMGEESGEIRPLMVRLVNCMRKWCIPEESNVEIWRMVPKIQCVLVREVAAFEDRLVELGYMDAKRTLSQKINAASSPSGLSVLVNQDEVGSPIDVDMTMDHESSADFSSPAIKDQTTSCNNTIRSSLSEITNAFVQAYSESQRSQILNRGRSILVNTDYHNSIQVGKFIPPAAEPGTLEHLDEDPLNVFVFQLCSVSTTAQQTYQLVRQTLNEAIKPEMAKELDALPPMLYRASREVLDLFRAIIPTLYASEIESIPRMAAILHNDCVYLAHEASLLGSEYKRKFRSSNENSQSKTHLLSEVCTFVDMVPPFRDLANKSMGAMLEVQKSQLFELISPRLTSFKEALSSNESVTEWDDAETALRAALYHLRHLCQSWRQVLSREVYHLTIGK